MIIYLIIILVLAYTSILNYYKLNINFVNFHLIRMMTKKLDIIFYIENNLIFILYIVIGTFNNYLIATHLLKKISILNTNSKNLL